MYSVHPAHRGLDELPPGRGGTRARARCDACGKEYARSFEVRMDGQTHTFDSFECAIQTLAPTCSHCGCRVIGHGVESQDALFLCANCARQSGEMRVAA